MKKVSEPLKPLKSLKSLKLRDCYLKRVKIASKLLFISLIFLATVQAQTVTEPAAPCLNLGGINPLPELGQGKIPNRHFDRSSENDEEWICWVHAHPNGQDFVVTPDSWGQNPNENKKQMINDALQGISMARTAFSGLVSSHTWPIYLVVDDLWESDPEATVKYRRCWIELGGVDWRAGRARFVQQVVAHEVGHCFISENIPNFQSSFLNSWWEEGAAEYLSTLAFSSLNAEHRFSLRYDLDGKDFRQKYDSFLFFDSHVKRNGRHSFLPLLRALHRNRVRILIPNADEGEIAALVPEQRLKELQFFRDSNLDIDFHNFTVEHFQSKVDDAGGGFYPRENTVATLYNYMLSEGREELSIGTIEGARLNKISVTIPQASIVYFQTPNFESGSVFATLIHDEGTPRLNRNITIRSLCEESYEISLLLTHFEDTPQEDIKIPYRLTEIDNCQDGEPVPTVPTPTRPTGPIWSSGGSYGDPHFYTFDKLGYSLQAVGEFVLVQAVDPTDEFKVQVRHRPVGSTVSLTSAVAMRVGNDVLNFHIDHKDEVNINGEWKTLEAGETLELAAGSIMDVSTNTRKDYNVRNYTVTWQDGTVLRLDVLANILIDAKVSLTAERLGFVQGLLGDANGELANDLTGRDGIIYSETPSFEQLYHGFGESWRISESESLFNYSSDETTETFTDRSFPLQSVPFEDISEEMLAAARVSCEAVDIKDSFAFDNCVLDVSITGDDVFALSAVSAGEVTEHVTTPDALTDKGQYVLTLEQSNGTMTFRSDDDPEANILALTDLSEGDDYSFLLAHPDLGLVYSFEDGNHVLILTRSSVQTDEYLTTQTVDAQLTRILRPEPRFLAGSVWGSLQAVFELSDGSELKLTLSGVGAQLQDPSRLFGN